MDSVAEYHFKASNDRKSPQWRRKAHAHAWAGVMAAIGAYDAFSRLAGATEEGSQTRPDGHGEVRDGEAAERPNPSLLPTQKDHP